MFQVKVLVISAELAALMGLALLLIMCVSGVTDFNGPRALMAFMLAIYAVILQSMQQSIPWKKKKEE